MQKSEESDVLKDEIELELDDRSLEEVEISDRTLETEDKKKKQAKKEAKKTAKKLLSPEERKQLRKKRALIGLGIVLALIITLLLIPLTRWPILSAVGFRGTIVITIKDNKDTPVAYAAARLEDGTVATTDKFGRAYFHEVTLGKKSIIVQKTGYGDKSFTLTAGFGTTKKSEQLKIIGIQLDIDIKSWLSGKPLEGAVATFEKATAASDASGRASLVIPPTDKKEVEIGLSAPGYLPKTIETATNVVSREILLVPAQKNYFVSKRDGKFDIFSSNLDGTDQRKLIEATGKEEEALLQLSIHRGNKQAVLVANRDGKIQNGRLIAGVYSVDLEKASIKKIDEGSDVQLLDWAENTIVYSKSTPELKYDDPSFSRLMSLNIATNKLSQVAEANYFQASLVAQNKLFYIPADAYRTTDNGGVMSYDLGSAAKRTYLPERQLSYLARSSYQTLDLQDNSGAAFELQIERGSVKPIDRRPTDSLVMALNPNGQSVAWAERRDGQGALLVRSLKDGKEQVVVRAAGLTSPIRFINDTAVVVRVATSQETADYAIDTLTGTLKKIVDVSNIGSVRQGTL